MNSENIKLILLAFVIVLLITVFVILLIVRKKNKNLEGQLTNIIDSISSFKQSLEQNERMVKDEFQRNREESNNVARANREELANTLRSFEKSFSENTKSLGDRIRDRFMDFERRQRRIRLLQKIFKILRVLSRRISSTYVKIMPNNSIRCARLSMRNYKKPLTNV